MPADDQRLNRHVPIEGTHNFRDAGGYPTRDGGSVRWRTLFRSDSLYGLTDASRQRIRDLGVRHAVDLRYERELSSRPSALSLDDRFAYHHLPTGPSIEPWAEPVESLEDLNLQLLESNRTFLLDIFETLARPHLCPAVISCTAGKDRTGLVTALLLGLAGVPPGIIVDDYMLTKRYASRLFTEVHERAESQGRDMAHVDRMLECRPEVMGSTLGYIDERYGGAYGYLRDIGVGEPAVAALRAALVDGRPGEPAA